ncbi:MAG: Protein TraC, partial [uncultured bacterium]
MKILEIAKKLAFALDEDKDTKVSEVTHADFKKINKLIAVDYPSFSSILPYRFFWEEKNLFINEHSIGFGLELTVFSGADEKLVNSISDLLRHRIDDDIDLQFILWGSNQVGDIIDNAYKHQVVNNDIYAELAKTSTQYYKKGARDGFKNKLNLPVTLREYRLFAFLSKNTPCSDKAVADIEAARDNFTVELESAGIGYIGINLKTFLALLKSWINPDIKDIEPRFPKHEEHSTLNEQVVDRSFELINEPERLTIEVDGGNNKNNENGENNKDKEENAGSDRYERNVEDLKNTNKRIKTKITNLSIRTLPDEFALWESPDNFFNVFRASQAIRCPFLISMHARLIPQVDAKSKAQSMYLSMDKKARSVYAKYVSGTQETALEWKKIRDDLASDTVRLAHSYFNLMLFSSVGEEKKDESSAISCYRYNGIELFNTKYMQLQSFLTTLPFMMSEGMFHDLKKAGRLKTLTTWNLANLLPLVADFKMCRQGVLLSSFRNQINFFDMYSDFLPTANYNIAVAATSGAGKSFLVQNILSYVLSIKGRCFVID